MTKERNGPEAQPVAGTKVRTRTLSAAIPTELHKRLRMHCVRRDLMMQAAVEAAVVAYLDAYINEHGG